MAFPQVVAAFHALFNVIGLPGNLLEIVTIVLERRSVHVMRYILLASFAASDILCLILTNSFRIASIGQERWLYGQMMCYLHPCFVRYFYFNTVLHLIAVSYERYRAIVKSPLTYDGTITKSKVVFMALMWIILIPFSITPFLGWRIYVYNPEAFYCEQGWSLQSGFIAGKIVFLALFSFVAPFDIVAVQVGTTSRSESQQQEMPRRMTERKAVDVIIILFLSIGTCKFETYH